MLNEFSTKRRNKFRWIPVKSKVDGQRLLAIDFDDGIISGKGLAAAGLGFITWNDKNVD